MKRLIAKTQAEIEGGWPVILIVTAIRAVQYIAIGALVHIGWGLVG